MNYKQAFHTLILPIKKHKKIKIMSNETKQKLTYPRFNWAININGTKENGIIDLETMTIMCLCTKEKADYILDRLNAMEGIEDPEGFVLLAKIMAEFTEMFKTKEDVIKLLKYKTACESINKDNPMVVAENLWNAVEYLKVMAYGTIDDIRKYREEAHKTLTKIQSK